MAVKKKEGENLSPSNIKKVSELLNSEKPISKKDACEMLNISYNTTRLKNILEEFSSREKYKQDMYQKKKGTEIQEMEVVYIIKQYLSGEPLAGICDSVYRSLSAVKNVLKTHKVPERETGGEYNNPPLIPDENLKEQYNNGDLVFSVRYNVPAIIKEFHKTQDIHGNVYKLWLMGKERMYAYQPWYELADLTHLQEKVGKDFEYEE